MKSSSIAQKQQFPIQIYDTASEEDFFLKHPNTVLLGFLGTVVAILLLLLLVVWIGYRIL